MSTVKVKLKKLFDTSIAPEYGTPGACALDLFACMNRPMKIMPGDTVPIPTGIAVELPTGYGLLVTPRSGLTAKHSVTVLNTPGLVDTDFRGEIHVLLHNLSDEPFYVNPDARIAQMIVMPIPRVELELVDELSETTRGTNGFGSTGM